MSTKTVVATVAAVAALAAAVIIPLAAAGGTYKPLDPTTAKHYANTGVGTVAGTTGHGVPVSPEEVASEDGVTLATVEGLTPGTAGARSSMFLSASSTICWKAMDNSTLATWWGIIPYQQNVWEHRHWCANQPGGRLTYVSSSPHLGSHWLCDTSDPYDEPYSGGIGYGWVTRETGGNFSCPTIIPWISIHKSRWQRWMSNSWGNTKWVGHS